MTVRYGDVVFGSVLAGLGLYVVLKASDWTYFSDSGPGPGYFPFWYGLAILVLSLVLIAKGLFGRGRDGQSEEAADWPGIRRALASFAALAVATALIYPLGMIPSFALLAVFMVRVIFGKDLKTAAIVSATGCLILYATFEVGLRMDLPHGMLGS